MLAAVNGSSGTIATDESFEFSCFDNVSGDSIHESEWDVNRPRGSFSTVGHGYAIAAVMSLYLLIGLPWNLLVVVIILKKRLFTQPAVMLMLNLALSNFPLYIFIIPLNIVTGIVGEYIFGRSDIVRCRVCQTSVALVLHALVSTHTLSLMAVDRFIYLRKPLTYKFIVTPKRMLAVILGMWLLSIVLALPPLFGFGEVRFSPSVASCTVFFARSTSIASNYLYVVILIVEGVVPFLLLFVMYVWIITIIRKFLMRTLHRTLGGDGGQHLETRVGIIKEYSRSQLHLVKVFITIFTSYLVTWLPLVPVAISAAVLGSGGVPTVVYSTAYLVLMSSTVIHPVVQAGLTHDIRVTIKDFFGRLCKRT